MAIKNDQLVGEAWVGHPYYEVIDNSTDFEMKMRRLTKTVADKLAIPNAEEWLDAKAVKMKFLVEGPWPIPGEYQGAIKPFKYMNIFSDLFINILLSEIATIGMFLP